MKSSDWELFQSIRDVLEQFELSTRQLSASRSVSISEALTEYDSILETIHKESLKESPLKKALESCHKKLQDYWGCLDIAPYYVTTGQFKFTFYVAISNLYL